MLFFVLIAPSLVGFQERYLFLAAAASGAFLASLLRALGGRLAVLAAILLAAVWIPALASQWQNWLEAATASRSLLEGLVQASLRPGVEEIVVANLPFRVRGGSVFVWGEFRDALALSGGRPVPVRGAAFVSYRNATDDALESAPPPAHVPQPGSVPFEVRLRIIEGPFSHYNGPGSLRASGRFETPAGKVVIEGGGRVTVGIAPDEGGRRAGYVWRKGRLEPLF